MNDKMIADLQALLDKQAITEQLMRYCRAVDRLDADLLRSVFWPDATDEHGTFKGNVEELIAYVFTALETQRTQHALGNILIELKSDTRALAESYVTAHHSIAGNYGPLEFRVGARYADEFEKRDGAWRILKRIVLIDHYRQDAGNGDFQSGIFKGLENRGSRFPDDISYRIGL